MGDLVLQCQGLQDACCLLGTRCCKCACPSSPGLVMLSHVRAELALLPFPGILRCHAAAADDLQHRKMLARKGASSAGLQLCCQLFKHHSLRCAAGLCKLAAAGHHSCSQKGCCFAGLQLSCLVFSSRVLWAAGRRKPGAAHHLQRPVCPYPAGLRSGVDAAHIAGAGHVWGYPRGGGGQGRGRPAARDRGGQLSGLLCTHATKQRLAKGCAEEDASCDVEAVTCVVCCVAACRYHRQIGELAAVTSDGLLDRVRGGQTT